MEQDADATPTEAVNKDESSMKDPETTLEGASELSVQKCCRRYASRSRTVC